MTSDVSSRTPSGSLLCVIPSTGTLEFVFTTTLPPPPPPCLRSHPCPRSYPYPHPRPPHPTTTTTTTTIKNDTVFIYLHLNVKIEEGTKNIPWRTSPCRVSFRLVSVYRDKIERPNPLPFRPYFQHLQQAIVARYRPPGGNAILPPQPTFSEFVDFLVESTENFKTVDDWMGNVSGLCFLVCLCF